MWSSSSRPKLKFVSEQAGDAETRLKSALVPVLVQLPFVERAFLARVRLGFVFRKDVVAVCVYGPAKDDEYKALLAALGPVLEAVIGDDGDVYVLPLDIMETEAVAKVCHPFFTANQCR